MTKNTEGNSYRPGGIIYTDDPSKVLLMTEGKKEGKKNDDGKLRFDLIPTRPLEGLADVFTRGARKYSDRNWEEGFYWSRVYGALLRHVMAFWKGEEYDLEDGQHHLDSVAWCAFALREFGYTHPELDDRPSSSRNQKEPDRYVPGVPCLTSSPSSQLDLFTSTSGDNTVEYTNYPDKDLQGLK